MLLDILIILYPKPLKEIGTVDTVLPLLYLEKMKKKGKKRWELLLTG